MKYAFKYGILALLIAAALGTRVMPVSASSYDFEIINNLNNTVTVALCYYDTDRGAWCNRGWFNVKSGEVRSIRLDNIDIRKGMNYYAESNGKVCIDGYVQSKTVRGWVDQGAAFKYYGSHPKANPGGKKPQVVSWYSLPYNSDYMGITINSIPRG